MTDNTVASLNTPQDPLTEQIRQGARDLILEAAKAELQQLLTQTQNTMLDGKQAIVRNGFLPERTLSTGVGNVGVKFNSSLITPYLKRIKSVATLLPQLYFKGISTGDMNLALEFCWMMIREHYQPIASVTSKSTGTLNTNNGVSVTSVDVVISNFGVTVFTVTLGWTIRSVYSSLLVSMTLGAKRPLASGWSSRIRS